MVKIALIHQLAAETLHVVGACLLLLIRAAWEGAIETGTDSRMSVRKNLCMV